MYIMYGLIVGLKKVRSCCWIWYLVGLCFGNWVCCF